MPIVLAFAALAIVSERYLAAPTFPSGGDAGCPCIDVTSHLAIHAPALVDAGSGDAAPCSAWSDDTGVCLPDTYGSGLCNRWDDPTVVTTPISSACAATGLAKPPPWCSAAFCYVDGLNCHTKPHSAAAYRWGGQILPARARVSLQRIESWSAVCPLKVKRLFRISCQLHYSYHTCGYIDSFVDTRNKLANVTLRVTAPAVTNPTAHFWREDANGLIDAYGDVWKGATWHMLQTISNQYGFTLERQRLSAEAIARSGGSNNFTACTYAVATNETDICVADFWATSTRRALMAPTGAFTAAFDTEEFYLVSHEDIQKEQWGVQFLHAFSPAAWMVVVCVVVWMSITYYAAEKISALRRKERRAKRRKDEGHVAVADREPDGDDTGLETFTDVCHAVLTSPMPTNHDPSSRGGRVVNIGCVFFALIATTFWSSAVVSQMVASTFSKLSSVSSLVEVQQRNRRICSAKALLDGLKAQTVLPNPAAPKWSPDAVSELVVDGVSSIGSLHGMDTGLCSHAVLGRSQIEMVLAINKTQCNKGAIGSSIQPAEKVAFPVRNEIEPILSFMIHEYTKAVPYRVDFANAMRSRWPQTCPVFLSQRAQTSSNFVAVEFGQINVPMVIALSMGVAGVLIARYESGEHDDWLAHKREKMTTGDRVGKGITRAFRRSRAAGVQATRRTCPEAFASPSPSNDRVAA
jgi:hypothetical protein